MSAYDRRDDVGQETVVTSKTHIQRNSEETLVETDDSEKETNKLKEGLNKFRWTYHFRPGSPHIRGVRINFKQVGVEGPKPWRHLTVRLFLQEVYFV